MKKTASKNRPRRKRKFPLWQIIVLLICVPTFLISTHFFLNDFLRYRNEDRANMELAHRIQKERRHSEQTSKKWEEYNALWEQNHDFAGWLFIEDTRIDYPVMHTPDDPEYYLYRAFDGSDAQSGSLFADGAYAIDGNSLLIYGHHMKDKSMFGSLTDYQSYEFSQTIVFP